MEEAARCRRAARSAVRDVDPDALREAMESVLDDGSPTPGVLTLVSARAAVAETGGGGESTVPDHVDQRAAGVQLIYEGLGLIRRLAREEPWKGLVTVEGPPPEADLTDENLRMIAADVLVARGFYLLARTEAADKAVETVRNFGRDQTLVRTGEDRDVELEADVLQLAVIAGVTAVGADPNEETLDLAADVARSVGTPLPAPDPVLAAFDIDDSTATPASADGGARTSVTDP
jgi:hypothetical protein